MQVQGKIKVINETQTISEKFKKRELVVTTDDQYPQDIMIQFAQDKCDVLNNYKVGNDVEVSINLRGREWTNPQGEVKYFNTIEGWRINNLDKSKTTEQQILDTDDDIMF
jgi:hypothetical protein